MKILLPMDCADAEEARLVPLNDVAKWALVGIEEGRMRGIEFADAREAFEEFIDAVVVVGDNEYVWPFMEEHITVLVAHFQRSIEDIVEAFLFKELNELAF